MNRRRLLSYWLARIGLNVLSITLFKVATSLVGVEFSMGLYWCAFLSYIVLSLGDGVLDHF